jgi:hypothetical protein
MFALIQNRYKYACLNSLKRTHHSLSPHKSPTKSIAMENSQPPHQPSTHVPSMTDIQPSLLSPQRHETEGGLSTRQIIDSASYNTTPADSPPNEFSDVFSAQDSHRAEPSAAALADADRAILEKTAQPMRRNSSSGNYVHALQDARKRSLDRERGEEKGKEERERQGHNANEHVHEHAHAPHGIIPPYMLKSIAASEKAGRQARESARQTLASETAGRDARRSSHER